MKNLIIFFLALTTFSCKSQNSETKKEEKKYVSISAKTLDKAILAGGKLIRVDSFPSKLIKPRPVDVWLPENYSSTKKYAVLYMHDGQNLFDDTTTWNKQEWMIDDVATQLMKEDKVKDFIVVAIHNIPAIRWQDLFPEKALNYIPKETKEKLFAEAKKNSFSLDFRGDEYLKFIVTELKPYVDKTYSVFTNKQNTFVMGSSMGGLMSMYAVAEYPEVFDGAACVSTHWVGGMPQKNNPLPKAIFSYLEENLPASKSHKMYFDYGNKTLDQHYPKFAPKVDAIFKKGGYSADNFKNIFFEGTDHSENSWQKRVDIPLTFLLKK